MEKDPLEINGMHDGAIPIIFRYARKLRNHMTKAERLVWDYLKNHSLGFKFRRQHPINKYILDFYCHQKRLSIEIDGGYHFHEEQKERDKDRTAYLESVGITEIRFANDEVLDDFENVKMLIEEELGRSKHSKFGAKSE